MTLGRAARAAAVLAFIATGLSAQSPSTGPSPRSAPLPAAALEPPVAVKRTLAARAAVGPIVVDGVLDEAAWQGAPVAGDFVQGEPRTGQPATEATEVRVLYDATTLYIGAYLHDREAAGIIVNDIKKDFKEEEPLVRATMTVAASCRAASAALILPSPSSAESSCGLAAA